MFNRPILTLLLGAVLIARCPPAAAQIPLQPPAGPGEAGSGGPIQVQELASLNPNEIGLLDEAHGGLGLTMWKDSGLGLVSKALPLLPNQPGWRSLRALEIRLLESAATLPPGKSPGEPLIAIRTGKLAGLGANDGVANLLKMLPSPAMTPILRRLQLDSLLLGGDNQGACTLEQALRVGQSNDNQALQLQVFCQFLGGHGNEASLGIDLLRDQKLKAPLFFAAADALSGLPPPAKLEGMAEAAPLDLAMANLAKLPLPENSVGAVPPAYLSAITTAAGTSLETRLAAAERGVALGTVPVAVLRQIAEQIPFTATELANAATEPGKNARSRALIYKAASLQILPSGRTELIARALSADSVLAPQLYAPMLAALPASPDLAGFAPQAVRALLATGHKDAAKAWLGVLRADALLSVSSANAYASLKPLTRLAGLSDPLTSVDLAAWRQARNDNPVDATKRSLLLLCLLSSLGDTPPETEWLALLDGPAVITGKVSRSALMAGLQSAAAAQKRGETALYALLALGDQREVEPGQFAEIISALRAVGLEADARAFATELALTYGL